MLRYILLLAAAALCCWPEARVARRLRYCAPRTHRAGARNTARRWSRVSLLLGLPAVLATYGLLGVVGATGCVVLSAAVWKQYAEHAHTKAGFAAGRRMAEALRSMVAELRAGAHPAAAAESAAADSSADTASALRTVAATARLGGAPEAVPAPHSGTTRGSDPVAQIGRSWALAQRHGLPLADVLDALRADVDGRTRFASNTHAGMAGARASAVVLACLPAAGLGLGQAMGADPLRLLASTPAGQVLLGVGCMLIACGLQWSARLTRSGVRT